MRLIADIVAARALISVLDAMPIGMVTHTQRILPEMYSMPIRVSDLVIAPMNGSLLKR
jgi:hypothetical protein